MKSIPTCFAPAVDAVEPLAGLGRPAVVAIDGRCGSGKTALGELLRERFRCNLVHMDDFYLPSAQRTPGWEARPAGNMDMKRFQSEVLLPALAGELKGYSPYVCADGEMGGWTALPGTPLTVIEGSYSLFPTLAGYYARKIFLTCAREEQLRRLKKREEEHFPAFLQRWIPCEERYFHVCGLPGNDCLTVDTT